MKGILIRVSAWIIAILMLIGAVCTTAFATRVNIAPISASAQTSARAMCTIEVSTGRVLFEKNANDKLSMASTTKVVTAITVLENCDNIDEVVKVNDKAIGIEGTSIYLQKGEKLTVRELLLGLMLRSGNDASVALALHISPTVEAFCEKMRKTAVKAGAVNSSFKNPHGLDEEGHYTTARDLALISAYALKNPLFAEIVSTKSAKISGAEYPRVLQNKNRLLTGMEGCIGVKTGFTKKAGRCYVGAAMRNGIRVVCVVLNCGPMFEEAAVLMDAALKKCAADKQYNEKTWYAGKLAHGAQCDIIGSCESTSTLPPAESVQEEQPKISSSTGVSKLTA